ncbi:MAG: hypothetical protein GY794_23825 [bacterium]|nr:hypothetical protein [bacterium]
MSKRIYIIVAVSLFFFAGYFSGPVLKAMEHFVVPDHVAPLAVLKATGGISIYFRFLLPFGLACAAIPIAFMIIKNHRRATLIVILSLVGSGIALLVIRYRLRAGLAYSESLGIKVMLVKGKLHLEIVPWVLFTITVLGTVVLKLKDNKNSQSDAPADPPDA